MFWTPLELCLHVLAMCSPSWSVPRHQQLCNHSWNFLRYVMEPSLYQALGPRGSRRLIRPPAPTITCCLHFGMILESSTPEMPVRTPITQRVPYPIDDIRIPGPVVAPVALHISITKGTHELRNGSGKGLGQSYGYVLRLAEPGPERPRAPTAKSRRPPRAPLAKAVAQVCEPTFWN